MLRLSEIYVSVQGESRYVGMPTVFVRFAGCNMRCPGWACDTQHAIDPALYRNEWIRLEPEALLKKIQALAHYDTIPNICLTGGEVFQQHHDDLRTLVSGLHADGKHVECFTNASIKFPDWSMDDTQTGHYIVKTIDVKLPGSGEDPLKFDGFKYNMRNLHPLDCIKFTIVDRTDFETALDIYKNLEQLIVFDNDWEMLEVFCGPVWGKMDPAVLVDWIIEAGMDWRLNLQTHKYIFNPEERGV